MSSGSAQTRGLISTGLAPSRYRVAADLIDPPGLKWRKDPVLWTKERAKIETWSKQKEIIQSVRDHRQTAVHSCHEVGKSFIAATTACWWIDVHPAGEAFVVTTAPSDKQVKAILWREINRMHSKLGLAGRTNLSEWYIGKELVAFGRKPADYDPTAFQGLHAKYMLVIIDEACGVPKELWDAASSLVADEHGKALAIGNPDDPDGEFADNCKPGKGWNVIHIGYKHTPNFTKEAVSDDLKIRLISKAWVTERGIKWGPESALFSSKCEGLFPVNSEFGVVPLGWVEQCRYLEYPLSTPVQGGLDVGAGGDRTILRERRGLKAGREEVFIDADPMRTVGRIVEKINEWGLEKVKVDPIGIGWGILGRLRELSSKHNPSDPSVTHHAEVIGINFAESPTPGTEHLFLNKRAEVWWTIGREYSRLKRWDLSDIDEDTLGELCSPKYEIMDSKGKIKIEAKDEVRKRLGRSPDSADALLLAFVDPESRGEIGGGDRAAEVNLLSGSGQSSGHLDPGGWSPFGGR